MVRSEALIITDTPPFSVDHDFADYVHDGVNDWGELGTVKPALVEKGEQCKING